MSKIIKTGSGNEKVEKFKFPRLEDYLSENPVESFGDQGARTGAVFTDAGNQPGAMTGQGAPTAAGELVDSARQEADAIRAKAKEEGKLEGMAQGKTEAQSEMQAVVKNLEGIVNSLARLKGKIIKDSEGDIIDLSLEIARKVIGADLDLDPGKVQHVIRAALKKISDTEGITVKINPEDHNFLRKNHPETLEENWLTADSTVTRGGVVIESPSGFLDAQVEAQLAEIEKNLKQSIVTESEEQ